MINSNNNVKSSPLRTNKCQYKKIKDDKNKKTTVKTVKSTILDNGKYSAELDTKDLSYIKKQRKSIVEAIEELKEYKNKFKNHCIFRYETTNNKNINQKTTDLNDNNIKSCECEILDQKYILFIITDKRVRKDQLTIPYEIKNDSKQSGLTETLNDLEEKIKIIDRQIAVQENQRYQQQQNLLPNNTNTKVNEINLSIDSLGDESHKPISFWKKRNNLPDPQFHGMSEDDISKIETDYTYRPMYKQNQSDKDFLCLAADPDSGKNKSIKENVERHLSEDLSLTKKNSLEPNIINKSPSEKKNTTKVITDSYSDTDNFSYEQENNFHIDSNSIFEDLNNEKFTVHENNSPVIKSPKKLSTTVIKEDIMVNGLKKCRQCKNGISTKEVVYTYIYVNNENSISEIQAMLKNIYAIIDRILSLSRMNYYYPKAMYYYRYLFKK